MVNQDNKKTIDVPRDNPNQEMRGEGKHLIALRLLSGQTPKQINRETTYTLVYINDIDKQLQKDLTTFNVDNLLSLITRKFHSLTAHHDEAVRVMLSEFYAVDTALKRSPPPTAICRCTKEQNKNRSHVVKICNNCKDRKARQALTDRHITLSKELMNIDKLFIESLKTMGVATIANQPNSKVPPTPATNSEIGNGVSVDDLPTIYAGFGDDDRVLEEVDAIAARMRKHKAKAEVKKRVRKKVVKKDVGF